MNAESTDLTTEIPLRERHKQYTRDLILEALAEVITEDGIHDFAIQQVADRAGISHRTIYRHFSGREVLINEFSEWLNHRMLERGGIDEVSSADEIATAVEVNFSLWDDYPVLMGELAMTYFVADSHIEDRDRRNKDFRSLITEVAPILDPQDVQHAFIIIRLLSSSLAWTFFREQFDISGREAGKAVAWAIETLIRDLKDRNKEAE